MTDVPERILWAEDNARDRMLIMDSIDRLAPRPGVTLVPDGTLLLQALTQGLPDLVILDLKMPRLGGIETLAQIRGHPDWKSLRVTIFSSGNRPDEIERCQALGVEAVVQKPVDFDHFTNAVQRIVRSTRPALDVRRAPPLT